MSRRRGSCPGCDCDRPCLIFGDDFDRPNNTDLGSNWEELVGDSSIVDGELVIPTGGKVRCTVPHPVADTPTCIVKVKLTTIEDGSIYQVRVNALEDGTGGELVEFEITADSSFLRTENEEFETGDLGEWEDVTLLVCRSLGGIYAGIDRSVAIEWECLGTASGGRYVTLANGGGTTTWDDFEYEEHHVTNHECDPCVCHCEHTCTAKQLKLTITVTGGTLCDCIDGWECILTAVPGGGALYGFPADLAWEWTGLRPHADCLLNPQEIEWKYRLECVYTPCEGENWRLIGCAKDYTMPYSQCGIDNDEGEPYAWKSKGTEGDYDCNTACPVGVICDPFYLAFGPPFHCEYLAPLPPPAICEYIIEIVG